MFALLFKYQYTIYMFLDFQYCHYLIRFINEVRNIKKVIEERDFVNEIQKYVP